MGLTDNWQMGKTFNCMTTDICSPPPLLIQTLILNSLDAIFSVADNKNYMG